MKAKRQKYCSILLLFAGGCQFSASAAPQLSQDAPIWLSEALTLCFDHIKSETGGRKNAKGLEWESVMQEYPRQLRQDTNYSKDIEGNSYFLNYNIEAFGKYTRKGCNIIKMPSRAKRTLSTAVFDAFTSSPNFEGESIKFKACEQCLDDMAGHWSVKYLDKTYAISALSGTRNDITVRLTPIN